MSVEIISASISDKPIIRQMMELYLYDFSEFTKADINEHGYFGYSYLDNYWVESHRYPFLIRVKDKLAGFVLVHQNTYSSDNHYHLAEFFILRKYRKQGIGRQVAFYIFDLLCGGWEVYHAHTNLVAQKFWQNVIEEYTAGTYTETLMENNGWNGIMRCFDNTKLSP
ncbi:MAG: GNAT family N-acetyltransferase [Cyanobacteria bacterium P01_A01_bin.40]